MTQYLPSRNKIIFILLIILTILYLLMSKTYSDDLHKEYISKTNQEMQKLPLEVKGISYSFAQYNNLPQESNEIIYTCIGDKIYTTDSANTLEKTMQICKNDYENNSTTSYINQSSLMRDFSKWDDSYIPLERIIKKHLKEAKSYKLLKTTYSMHFNDKRPHMFVSIDYRGANLGGRISDRTMSIKVDAKTKELYDLK